MHTISVGVYFSSTERKDKRKAGGEEREVKGEDEEGKVREREEKAITWAAEEKGGKEKRMSKKADKGNKDKKIRSENEELHMIKGGGRKLRKKVKKMRHE